MSTITEIKNYIINEEFNKAASLLLELLSKNPNIFEIDYDFLKKRTSVFEEELISKVFHPKRVE